MEVEFSKWMNFYGKVHSKCKLEKGDFLSDNVKEMINSATSVATLHLFK